MFVVTIDRSTCEGCGECVDSCPAECLEMVDGKAAVVDGCECMGCETCITVCTTGSVTLEEV